MGRHFECTDEIIVVSKGKEDIGKVPALGNDGRLDPSVIPEMNVSGKAIAGLAKLKSDITMNASEVTKIMPLGNVIFDQGNYFAADGKVHISQDGVYLVNGQIDFDMESTGQGSRWVLIVKNGEETIACSNSSPSASTAGVSSATSLVTYLKKDDYLELLAGIGFKSAITTQAPILAHLTQLSIARLGD